MDVDRNKRTGVSVFRFMCGLHILSAMLTLCFCIVILFCVQFHGYFALNTEVMQKEID